MANTKSAAKRSRQSLKRGNQNRGVRTRLRTLQKRVGVATKPDAEQIRGLISALDKAAKRGIIHRNAADRRKARLNRQLKGAAVSK
jgi:small subunit ribosomal protein S20